jgi:hypothetical protein
MIAKNSADAHRAMILGHAGQEARGKRNLGENERR